MQDSELPQLLVFVRHGWSFVQSLETPPHYILSDEAKALIASMGINDFNNPLCFTGMRHMYKAGLALYRRFGVFDIVIHPDYVRNVQSALIVQRVYTKFGRRLRLAPNKLLRERNVGLTFAKNPEDVRREYPSVERDWCTKGLLKTRCPMGESMEDVVHRYSTFREKKFRCLAGKKVLVVSNRDVMIAARSVEEGWSEERTIYEMLHGGVPNCDIVVYRKRLGHGRLVYENCEPLLS